MTSEVKELKEMVPNQTSQSRSGPRPVDAINAGQTTKETYANTVLNVALKVTLLVVVGRPSRDTRDGYCQDTGSSQRMSAQVPPV